MTLIEAWKKAKDGQCITRPGEEIYTVEKEGWCCVAERNETFLDGLVQKFLADNGLDIEEACPSEDWEILQ